MGRVLSFETKAGRVVQALDNAPHHSLARPGSQSLVSNMTPLVCTGNNGNMSGETDLAKLLNGMTARLHDGVYVFATCVDPSIPAQTHARMVFQEDEGTTYILLENDAKRHDIPYEFPCRMITLDIHSALEAVGFIARVATALAQEGMGVNPVSGFYHDHLFVPLGREADAMRVIKELSQA